MTGRKRSSLRDHSGLCQVGCREKEDAAGFDTEKKSIRGIEEYVNKAHKRMKVLSTTQTPTPASQDEFSFKHKQQNDRNDILGIKRESPSMITRQYVSGMRSPWEWSTRQTPLQQGRKLPTELKKRLFFFITRCLCYGTLSNEGSLEMDYRYADSVKRDDE